MRFWMVLGVLKSAGCLKFAGPEGSKRVPKWVSEKVQGGSTRASPRERKVEFEVVVSEAGEMQFAAVEGAGQTATSARAELEAIYRVHNPSKLADIDWLLTKYEGKESLLVSAARAKYIGLPARVAASHEREEEAARAAREEVAELAGRLPESFDEVVEAMADERLREGLAAAVRGCVADLARRGEVARAFELAARAPVDAEGEDRLGNCRGALGAVGAVVAESGDAGGEVDRFVAIARACGDPEARLFDLPAAPSVVPDAAAMALAELCRRALRSAKERGADKPWRDALRVMYASPEREHPEILETLTRAMVADVTRVGDATAMAHLPSSSVPEVVCLGRSNVGKSSLVNSLIGRKALAPTSATPGRTRRFVLYRLNQRAGLEATLVDVPGSGYAVEDESTASAKVDSWRSLTERYLQVRDNLCAVLHLIDARRAADGRLPAADLDTLDRCVDANRRRSDDGKTRFLHALVLTKVDRLPSTKRDAALALLGAALADRGLLPVLADALPDDRPPPPDHVALILTSAARRRGHFHLWRTIAAAAAPPEAGSLLPPGPHSSPSPTPADDDSPITF